MPKKKLITTAVVNLKDGVSTGVKTMTDKVDVFDKKFRMAGDSLNTVSSKMGASITRFAKVGITALTGLGTAAVVMGAKFDIGIQRAINKTNDLSDTFRQRIKKDVIDVSKEFGLSTAAVTTGIQNIFENGITAADSVRKLTDASAQLTKALAGGNDTFAASNELLVGIANNFDINILKDTTQIAADILDVLGPKGGAGVETFANAIGTIGPKAKAAGQGLEPLLALTSTLIGTGASESIVFSGIGEAFATMQRDITGRFDDLFKDAAGRRRDFRDIVNDIADISDLEKQGKVIETIFRGPARTAVKLLVAEVDALNKTTLGSADSITRMQDKIDATQKTSSDLFSRMKTAATTTLAELGNAIVANEKFRETVQSIFGLMTKNKDTFVAAINAITTAAEKGLEVLEAFVGVERLNRDDGTIDKSNAVINRFQKNRRTSTPFTSQEAGAILRVFAGGDVPAGGNVGPLANRGFTGQFAFGALNNPDTFIIAGKKADKIADKILNQGKTGSGDLIDRVLGTKTAPTTTGSRSAAGALSAGEKFLERIKGGSRFTAERSLADVFESILKGEKVEPKGIIAGAKNSLIEALSDAGSSFVIDQVVSAGQNLLSKIPVIGKFFKNKKSPIEKAADKLQESSSNLDKAASKIQDCKCCCCCCDGCGGTGKSGKGGGGSALGLGGSNKIGLDQLSSLSSISDSLGTIKDLNIAEFGLNKTANKSINQFLDQFGFDTKKGIQSGLTTFATTGSPQAAVVNGVAAGFGLDTGSLLGAVPVVGDVLSGIGGLFGGGDSGGGFGLFSAGGAKSGMSIGNVNIQVRQISNAKDIRKAVQSIRGEMTELVEENPVKPNGAGKRRRI